MKLKIGVDMDNTITNFNQQFVKYILALGYEIDRKTMFTTWYLENSIIGLTDEQKTALVDEILFIDDFWLTMKPMPYAIEFMQWLNSKYDVQIITTPWRFNNKFYSTKLQWLEENMPYIRPEQVLFEKEKWLCPIDILIDDKPDTLIKCMEHDIFAIAYDQPYNRDLEVYMRIESWKNLPVCIKDIEKIYF